MKKVSNIISTLLLSSLLLSCTKSSNYIPPDQVAKNQSMTIIESIVNKDVESIKEILCDDLKNRNNIDESLRELFDFINGNIVSYDTPRGSVSSKESTTQGIVLEVLSGNIKNIVTDTGKNYEVNVESFYVNKEHGEYVGVMYIQVMDMDEFNKGSEDMDKLYRSISYMK